MALRLEKKQESEVVEAELKLLRFCLGGIDIQNEE